MDHFYRFSEKESSDAISQLAIGFKLEYLEEQSNLRFSLDLVTTHIDTPKKNSDESELWRCTCLQHSCNDFVLETRAVATGSFFICHLTFLICYLVDASRALLRKSSNLVADGPVATARGSDTCVALTSFSIRQSGESAAFGTERLA